MEPLNEKSQIAQEYGLLPADARQQKDQHSPSLFSYSPQHTRSDERAGGEGLGIGPIKSQPEADMNIHVKIKFLFRKQTLRKALM